MNKQRFEIKPEHLKLLQNFVVGWQDSEFGAPEIDPKRPYGNSDVEQDMLEILGLKELRSEVFEFELFSKKYLLKGKNKYNIYLEGPEEKDLVEELHKLHKETQLTLQICLMTQKFETGIFEEDEHYDWRKVEK